MGDNSPYTQTVGT